METTEHKMLWNNRRQGQVTGVKDVISFDNDQVVLETTMGILTIHGKELQVKQLSVERGELELQGMMDHVTYTQSKEEKGRRLFERLLK